MTAPRGLTPEERAAWQRVAASVTPLQPPRNAGADRPRGGGGRGAEQSAPPLPISVAPKIPVSPKPLPPPKPRLPFHQPVAAPPPRAGAPGLDSHWDRKFQAGRIEPDFTLDLHGHTLDSAHARLDDGLMQAKAMGARVVLLIAGKPRPVDAADRGSKRGAIRAKVLDWLAIGPHGADIAAIRKAHRRHGGEGALYLILKRRR